MLGKLKKIIQEANSKIMNIDFGCELEQKYDEDKIAKFVIVGTNIRTIKSIRTDEHSPMIFIERKNLDKYKILGRPITLADVLMTLNNKLTGDYILEKLIENNNGYLIFIDMDSNNRDELWSWNLKESLDGQSKKTIEFLYNLFK